MAAEVSEAAQQVQHLLAAQGRVAALEEELAAARHAAEEKDGQVSRRGQAFEAVQQAGHAAPAEEARAISVAMTTSVPMCPASLCPCSARSCLSRSRKLWLRRGLMPVWRLIALSSFWRRSEGWDRACWRRQMLQTWAGCPPFLKLTAAMTAAKAARQRALALL